jgi:hypothetical protein
MVMHGAEDRPGLQRHQPHPQLAGGHAFEFPFQVDGCQELDGDAPGLVGEWVSAHATLLWPIPPPVIQ